MIKSPFPGMDPYLEQASRDVHQSLCVYARDDIQTQLGDGLLARVDERLVVEQASTTVRSIVGDVRVVERARQKPARSIAPASGIALAEPVQLEVDETATEGFVQIIDRRSGGRVITIIEFLSITNKLRGQGREEYLRKQRELHQAKVSLVEINLFRDGPFIETFPETMLSAQNRTQYYAIVHRGWAGGTYQYYPMPLRERLPAIGIPLREDDPLVALDLQSLIDRVYNNGAYDEEIDYERNADPPLDAPDAKWADALLREAGLR